MPKVVKKNKHGNDLILPHQPYHDEFLQTMTKIFHWSRFVGIVGLESFVWRLWSVILLSLFIAIETEAIWKVIKALAGWAIDILGHRSVTARLAGTMFYSAALMSLILCWKLSCSWKELSKYWSSVEWALSIKYVPPDEALKIRMYKVACFVAVCATVEFSLNVISNIDYQCTYSTCLRIYILRTHGFLLLNHEYSDWIAVPLMFMSVVATILWNLQDLIVMLLSMGLSSRYKRLNQCVETVCERNNSSEKNNKDSDILKIYTWRKIREAYVKQTKLVRKVDNSMGGIILLSSFFNFYFICLQVFMWITQGLSDIAITQTYYVISLSWICVRTTYTVLSAANVNMYSKMALPYLSECQAQNYNVEIERLQKQLSRDFVALTGMGFFSLNRTVVLQIAGAVVTYVLVLIQYDDTEKTPANVTAIIIAE